MLLIAAFGVVPVLVVAVGAYFFGKSRVKAEAYENERDRSD